MKTFADLKELMKKEDELTFLEILDLTSVELVDLLEEELHDKQQKIRDYYNEDEEDGDGEEESYES